MDSSSKLPKSVQAVLWSYTPESIDLERHKRLIIANVLNFGTKEATNWLFSQYSRGEITKEADAVPLGQWNKKSLRLWSLVLGIKPQEKASSMVAA